jgi:ABC-2 type transport system ATP-binding protein
VPVVVRAEGLTKSYGANLALSGVDLSVAASSVHGIMGPNGSGKTTLLSVLLGLVIPDGGSVTLFGRSRQEAGPAWLDGVGGFVEAPRFYPYLSGRRNLQTLADLDGGLGRSGISELLELVGLADAADRRVKGYSLGMRQRLGLASALLRRPALLILDEPGNGLDPAGSRQLRAALRAVAAAGAAVIVALHDMAEAEHLCDEVTILARGRVRFSGSLRDLSRRASTGSWKVRTSDDDRAAEVAGVHIRPGPAGLVVEAAGDQLDRWVLDLAGLGIAVRELVPVRTPLEALYFRLTEGEPERPRAVVPV